MSMSQSSTPEVSTFTRASPKPGVGSSRSEISSGAPNSVTTAARMVSVVVSSVVVGVSRV